MNLTPNQIRMAAGAVSHVIAQCHRLGRQPPAGFYQFREDLLTSARGSEFNSGEAESVDEDDLIDTAEAAEILNRSTRWVRAICSDLDGRNIGGRWLFRRQNVIEYAENRINN